MPVILGPATYLAVPTATKRLAGEDAVADGEVVDGGALGDEHAGAFVRAGYGEADVREGAS